jgi:hypothetical protein
MPTGWRPKDVEKVFKYKTQFKKQKKYYPNYTNSYKILGIFQFLCVNTILTYFLYNFSNLEIDIKLIYTCIIFLSVFGYSSLMDNYSWAPFFEIFRSLLSLYLLNFVGELTIFKSFLFIYLFISIVISCLIIKKIGPFLNE